MNHEDIKIGGYYRFNEYLALPWHDRAKYDLETGIGQIIERSDDQTFLVNIAYESETNPTSGCIEHDQRMYASEIERPATEEETKEFMLKSIV